MNAYAAEAGGLPSPSSASPRIPVIFRRLHRFHQMDFELAAWQLTYLCIAPAPRLPQCLLPQANKNTWARDDPAILVLISACLCVSAAAWSFIYSRSVLGALQLALLMILRDLSAVRSGNINDIMVSFIVLYTFDVHTNAFFPFYLTLYLAQLFLLPVIRRDNWVCLWAGNTLYLAGFAQYIYGLYLGLSALPFLARTTLLLAPLLPLGAAYVVSLLGFNVARWVLRVYFGS
ncbi:UNC-50 [Mycena olivaceomarginata]|nr:UNC-50 [Mycena olivaceomarginata]